MLACPPDVPRHLAAVVAVSPHGDLHGATGLELVILGLLVEDWSDQRIAAALHLPLVWEAFKRGPPAARRVVGSCPLILDT